jgi:hypothetical protein
MLERSRGSASLSWSSEGAGTLLDHAVVDHEATPLSNVVCCATRAKALEIADLMNEQELIAKQGRDD